MLKAEMSVLLEDLEGICRLAGERILSVYNSNFSVTYKADKSPLTEADASAHEVIVSQLTKRYPDIPVLSEEDVGSFQGPNHLGQFFLVDPLDGTKEFLKRNGEFTVNIALIQNGKPAMGAVFAPVLDAYYSGGYKLGARLIKNKEEKALKVSTHQAGQPWKIVGSRSHSTPETENFLAQLEDPYEFMPMGSSLKFCLVAEGVAHLYPRLAPTNLWDTAAAQAVVSAAGGTVNDLSGNELDYSNWKQTLNPYFVVSSGSL